MKNMETLKDKRDKRMKAKRKTMEKRKNEDETL